MIDSLDTEFADWSPKRFQPTKRRANDGGESQWTLDEKADAAASAIAASNPDAGSTEENATDLLAHLLILCDREKIDPRDVIRSAWIHYICER